MGTLRRVGGRAALVATLVATIAGCSPGNSASLTVGSAASVSTVATNASAVARTYRDMAVGFVQAASPDGSGGADEWTQANTASFVDAAASLGIGLAIKPAGTVDAQVEALNAFVADPKINVIVLNPVSRTGYDQALKAAASAGKKVLVEGGAVSTDSSLYVARIGSDVTAEGQRAGAAMCELLRATAAKNVVELTTSDSATASDRNSGFKSTSSECGVTMAQVQQASGLGDANTAMTAILQHSRDVQGVFADTDEAAIGAIHALATSGMEPGRQVQVISIGASRSAFYFLITGQLSASLECNPVLGPQVYARALDALNGVTPGPTWGPSQEATFFASQGADALWTILEARKY